MYYIYIYNKNSYVIDIWLGYGSFKIIYLYFNKLVVE